MSDKKRGDSGAPSFAGEILDFIIHRKRWWMVPIIVVLILLAIVAILGGLAPTMPFIYTIF